MTSLHTGVVQNTILETLVKRCRFVFGVFLVIMCIMLVADMWIFVVVVCPVELAISRTAKLVFVTFTLI